VITEYFAAIEEARCETSYWFLYFDAGSFYQILNLSCLIVFAPSFFVFYFTLQSTLA
jgi:hypothetical protein